MPVDSDNTAIRPPPVVTPVFERDMRALRVRDLRRDSVLLTEGQGKSQLFSTFAPIVHGLAKSLVPEDPAAAEGITAAVFQTFSLRWHRVPRRLFVAVWLFQTTLIAARRERKRLKLSRQPSTSSQLLLMHLSRLPPKLRDATILAELLQLRLDSVAEALRARTERVSKRVAGAVAKLQKRLRRMGGDAQSILRGIAHQPSTDVEERVLGQLREPAVATPLVRQTVRSWRWIQLRGFIKRALATVGAVLCVLAVGLGTFAYLATHGYLMGFFIRMQQQQARKEFPEMFVPARPWPVSPEDHVIARSTPPINSDDLFRMTNIWPVKLTITSAQLKQMEPSRVPPIRNIFQDGRIILRNPKAKRSGLAGVLGFEFNWAEASLAFDGLSYDRIGARFRGNGTYVNSLSGDKQSVKLDVSKYAKTNELAGVSELNLLNTIVDYSYLHDVLAQNLFRELGAIGPRTAYAYVTVEVAGKGEAEPRGLFVLMENIDADFAKHRFGTKKTPIFKPVTYDLFHDLGDDWKAYSKIYDLKTKATPEQQRRVIDFAKLVSHGTDEEFAQKLPDFLDLPEFAAFLAGHVLLASYDGFLVNGQNYYVYLDPRSNKFGFVPWDQDHSWGDFGHIGTNEQRENASIWKPAIYDFRFLNRVMKVEEFRSVYREKLESALAGSFTKEKLFAQIDDLAKRIRPAVAAESGFRLKRFDQAVSGEWLPGPRDGEAEGPKAPVHQIKRFITNRIQSVRDQLDGKSEGMRLSFR